MGTGDLPPPRKIPTKTLKGEVSVLVSGVGVNCGRRVGTPPPRGLDSRPLRLDLPEGEGLDGV